MLHSHRTSCSEIDSPSSQPHPKPTHHILLPIKTQCRQAAKVGLENKFHDLRRYCTLRFPPSVDFLPRELVHASIREAKTPRSGGSLFKSTKLLPWGDNFLYLPTSTQLQHRSNFASLHTDRRYCRREENTVSIPPSADPTCQNAQSPSPSQLTSLPRMVCRLRSKEADNHSDLLICDISGPVGRIRLDAAGKDLDVTCVFENAGHATGQKPPRPVATRCWFGKNPVRQAGFQTNPKRPSQGHLSTISTQLTRPCIHFPPSYTTG
ncbi:hypothetical protein N7468_008726 [Penicillium chermesinum]|uniref:Uncharacterized protein n=1 Tax=Penicillium chermesinum TaxID=63820 RepID=A0A9W9NGF8_9EURO|nr:uncharacterized protein N7468_008726 [Penicillium chermesinum]KAJ5219522.1 hypothetical protein N7468_008726 [Penicillium chermesinum]